ncbi:MAG TPA: hypothetical protein VKT80_07825 [Chloroflexota bacterium]|nr:hypothetical protein [Chloroflexota bacterium]
MEFQSVPVDRKIRSFRDERLERTKQTLVKLGDDAATVANDVVMVLERTREIATFISGVHNRLGQAKLDHELEGTVNAGQAHRAVAKQSGQLRRRDRSPLPEECFDDVAPWPGELMAACLQALESVQKVIANHLQLE